MSRSTAGGSIERASDLNASRRREGGNAPDGHVSAAAVDRRRMAAGDEDEPLELGHEDAVLVEHARVHADRPAVALGCRLALLEHLRLAEQRVAVEHRCRM